MKIAEKYPSVPYLHPIRRARCIQDKCRTRLNKTVRQRMSQKNISSIVAIIAIFVAGFISILAAQYAGLAGARMGGLQEGGWNWQFLKPLSIGRSLGIVLTLLIGLSASIVISFSRYRVLPVVATLILPSLLIFFGTMISYHMKLQPDKKRHEETMRMVSNAYANTDYRNELVNKARKGQITKGERWALMQAIWRSRPLLDDDVSFLINYFSDDVSVVDPLLRYDSVSLEDLVAAYERHKLDPGHSRISQVLVDSGRAPIEILEDIVEHNTRYPKSHRYSNRLIEQAKHQLENR